MIGVKIYGRLGNQMFQYALALTLSKTLHKRFMLSYDHYGIEIDKYFECSSFSGLLNRIYNWLLKKRIIRLTERSFGSRWVDPINAQNKLHYLGFFQSFSYFEKYEGLIRKEFVVKRKYQNSYQEKAAKLTSIDLPRIVIHVRRDDYSNDMILPLDYYRDAISQIHEITHYKIFLVGHRISEYQSEFNFLPGYQVFEGSIMDDFQFIMNSEILILSNSTFAWWAGFLSTSAKKIIAPKYWLNVQGPEQHPKGISYGLNWLWI